VVEKLCGEEAGGGGVDLGDWRIEELENRGIEESIFRIYSRRVLLRNRSTRFFYWRYAVDCLIFAAHNSNMITALDQLDPKGVYSYADYLTWKFEETLELIRGKILPMAAPGRTHQRLSINIFMQFQHQQHPSIV
jgi:hypothetical protein